MYSSDFVCLSLLKNTSLKFLPPPTTYCRRVGLSLLKMTSICIFSISSWSQGLRDSEEDFWSLWGAWRRRTGAIQSRGGGGFGGAAVRPHPTRRPDEQPGRPGGKWLPDATHPGRGTTFRTIMWLQSSVQMCVCVCSCSRSSAHTWSSSSSSYTRCLRRWSSWLLPRWT